jgi:hypothetical protein
MIRTFLSLALLAAASLAPAGAAPIFTLDNPIATGAPGSTVGWGFTLSNDENFLLITSFQYCADPGALPACTTSSLGTFTSFAGLPTNFDVVGPAPEPSTSITRAFVNNVSGVGSFLINAGATPGALENGIIVLTYDLYSVSPNDGNFNPDTDILSLGNTLNAEASVSVAAEAAIPEPATVALTGAALAGLALLRRRR